MILILYLASLRYELYNALSNPIAMKGLISTIFPTFIMIFILHLFISTFVVGVSASFIQMRTKQKASMRKAIHSFIPLFIPLFFAKIVIWLLSFIAIFICSLMIAIGIVSSHPIIFIVLVFSGIALFVLIEAFLSIANSLLPASIVVEKRRAPDGILRAFSITKRNISKELLSLFIASIAASFFIMLISFVPAFGCFISNFIMLVVAAYFLCAWLIFYFMFEKKINI